jgi:glycosyltransferase involved in cell wall biosynthesis
MKKLKILYNFRPGYDIDKTGIPFFVKNLYHALLNKPEISLSRFGIDSSGCRKWNSCRFFSLKSTCLTWKLCKFFTLAHIINRTLLLPLKLSFGKYDFYIENETFFLPLYKPRHTKTITVIHDIGPILFNHIQTKKVTRLFHLLLPVSLKNSDYIVTVSESSKQDIERYLQSLNQKKEVFVIYNDSTLDNHNDADPLSTLQKFNITDEYFLFLGTLEPRKNPLNTVKAFQRFKMNYPDNPIKLVFAGRKGWLYDDVIDYIEHNGLHSEIIFTGYISDEEKYVLLKHAKAFLFLSIYEGFGIPPLEALKLGTPCLLSDIPVFHELFEDNALYVPYDNLNIIAEGMNTILNHPPKIDPELFEKFSWDKSAEKLIQFMKDKTES